MTRASKAVIAAAFIAVTSTRAQTPSRVQSSREVPVPAPAKADADFAGLFRFEPTGLSLAPIQHGIVANMTEVTIGYPKSPLNGPSLGGKLPQSGARVAPLAGQEPVGSGGAPRFALRAEETPATAELVSRFPSLLDPAVRPPLARDAIVLVRPDGYAACSSRDANVIAGYLDDLIRPSKPHFGRW